MVDEDGPVPIVAVEFGESEIERESGPEKEE